MKVKVWSANAYRGNTQLGALLTTLEDSGADVIGVQEGIHIAALMGYRRLRCDVAAGPQGTEVPIFLTRTLDYRGHGAYQASEDTGRPVGHDRWITWTRWVQGGHRLVLINTHVNADLQEKPSGALVDGEHVDEARRHMKRLLDEIDRQRSDGWLPIVTGDFNYFRRRQQTGRLWRWSPQRALRRAGLTYLGHGLMGVAVPRHVAVLRAGTVKLPGSDHPGLEVLIDVGEDIT